MKTELTPVCVEILPGKQRDVVKSIADIRVTVGHQSFIIPKGFRSDLASIPRMFWRFLPPWGCWRRAAFCHDALYRLGMFSRSECDTMFFHLMSHDRVHPAAKWLLYLGVRIGGWWAFKKKQS